MGRYAKLILSSTVIIALAIMVAGGTAKAGTYSRVAYCNVSTAVSGNTQHARSGRGHRHGMRHLFDNFH